MDAWANSNRCFLSSCFWRCLLPRHLFAVRWYDQPNSHAVHLFSSLCTAFCTSVLTIRCYCCISVLRLSLLDLMDILYEGKLTEKLANVADKS